MKAYKVELLIIDHDALGANEIATIIEETKYPNRCIFPTVMDMFEQDIGEWTDDHPLNNYSTMLQEYKRLFTDQDTKWDGISTIPSYTGPIKIKN